MSFPAALPREARVGPSPLDRLRALSDSLKGNRGRTGLSVSAYINGTQISTVWGGETSGVAPITRRVSAASAANGAVFSQSRLCIRQEYRVNQLYFVERRREEAYNSGHDGHELKSRRFPNAPIFHARSRASF